MADLGWGPYPIPVAAWEESAFVPWKTVEEKCRALQEDMPIGQSPQVRRHPRENWTSSTISTSAGTPRSLPSVSWLAETWKRRNCSRSNPYALYFRCADLVALHNCSYIPVGLLRFASELVEIHCSQRSGACSGELPRALLTLPFKERAVFIVVSILRVQPSVAAVALGLRGKQLGDYWIRTALRLRGSWLRSLEPQRRTQRYATACATFGKRLFFYRSRIAAAPSCLEDMGGVRK
jgi:hypothetical protein